jgi:hypothetical protein
MDDIAADLKVMKIKQWIEKMKDREQWRLVVEGAVAPRIRKKHITWKAFQLSDQETFPATE